MNRRNVLLTVTSLPVIGFMGMGGYKTPPGAEPVEVLVNGEWVEYPFDDLVPGDYLRYIRFRNEGVSVVESFPHMRDGVMTVLANKRSV